MSLATKTRYLKFDFDGPPTEAWFISDDKMNCVYIPSHNLLIELTDDGVTDIELFIETHQTSKTINEVHKQLQANPVPPVRDRKNEEYAPTVVGLGLTDICQLRCVYCHSESGEEHKNKFLDIYAAKAAIDLAAESAQKFDRLMEISFTGPGEPTMAWDLLTEIIDYAYKVASRRGIKAKTTMASNGYYGDEKRKYIVENFNGVSLSMDGYEAIQNLQRPQRNGKPSFELVFQTAQYFHSHWGTGKRKFTFALRPTISQYSL